ncbi:MAG: hypothetical protein HYZ08_01940 [Candidatus Kerfeldbacteria bacterium]|nr:hypothetical protein [Candidatus Kerfeldbacteria bacterium]
MISQRVSQPIKFFVTDLLFDVVRFPVWWYTRGTAMVARSVARSFEDLIQSLSLGILFKNLFVPMYGDYTKSGRIISFGVRLVQVSVYVFVTVLWMLILGVGLFLWWLIPVFVAIQLYDQFIQPDVPVLLQLWKMISR